MGTDLKTKVPLSLILPQTGFEVLQVSLADQTRDANDAAIDDQRRLTFDYLNPRDGFVIDIFGDDKEEIFRGGEKVVGLKGEIAGTTGDARYAPYELSASRAPGYILIAFALMFELLATGAIFDPLLSTLDALKAALGALVPFQVSPEVDRLLNFGAGIIFALGGVVMLLGGLLIIFRSERLPAKLLARDEEGRVPFLTRLFSSLG